MKYSDFQKLKKDNYYTCLNSECFNCFLLKGCKRDFKLKTDKDKILRQNINNIIKEIVKNEK